MYKHNWFFVGLCCALGVMPVHDAFCATVKKAAKQSAIQKGTSVRVKSEAKGIYDQECYEAYYGCMDQFCMSDNESGGSCICSDAYPEYEAKLNSIKEQLIEAERISTVEVEKVKAGADADIIFTGERQYDKKGNLLSLDQVQGKKSTGLLALWDEAVEEEEEDTDSIFFGDELTDLTGAALHRAAQDLCMEQMPEKCDTDIDLLANMYSRQIVSDCKGLENSLVQKQSEADLATSKAEAAVRTALQESLSESNKYTLGECMVEFKKCMRGADACGTDWEHCVGQVASENMQKSSSRGKSYGSKSAYNITESTMETLEAKRPICERVLSSCVAVRDNVWPSFLKEVAPTIQLAESHIESRFRQSCLTDISNCIHTACKDDIAGKGVATMDSCLAYPEMARSFCKVELEPCEKMEPLIWNYVTDKLAAMRVDACTQEVKDCFTHESRCGENFQNCIGIDFEHIHDMCPVDSLVVCKQGNQDFNLDDLDKMLMGLYLNIDTTLADQCQEIVDNKMMEICGSTTDCNKFASDDTIGTGSLRSQKDGIVYRLTGMISFGSIQVGNASDYDPKSSISNQLKPGEIGVAEYLKKIKEVNSDVPNHEGIISAIEEELNNIAGTINRTIEMIEQDQKIQHCINGRNLEQITGDKKDVTTGRFPNLLNQIKMQIAVAALRRAQDNYNAKWNEMLAAANHDASADVAQYMCQKMAENSATTLTSQTIDLAPPFAISYEVGSGLNVNDLTVGGHALTDLGQTTYKNDGYLGKSSGTFGAGTKETTATFNRETRICHLCTTIVTQSCKTTGSKSWFHNNRNTSCTTGEPIQKCEDIQM